jgi:hypothetical protein
VASSRTLNQWQDEEIYELYKGVRTFGLGKWASIISTGKFPKYRTNVHLKDKWRNIVSKKSLMKELATKFGALH